MNNFAYIVLAIFYIGGYYTMCTAITLQANTGENIFGRTMDFSYPIEPIIYKIPKDYHWKGLSTNKQFTNKYQFIALGQEAEGMLGFFDGVNEKGFAAAALYFEGYADYNLKEKNKTKLDSIDFLHFLLGNCDSVATLKQLLKNITIIGFVDPITKRIAPLHWIATDQSGETVVIEQTKNGLQIFNNKIGVLANSPNFEWQLTNLRNYTEVTTTQKDEANWDGHILKPFSQGAGTNHLPGGFASPARFVRTSFLKTHTNMPKTSSEAIMTGFHLLKNVFIPKGVVITTRGTDDYTKYTAMINTKTCEYFIRTYNNDETVTAKLTN